MTTLIGIKAEKGLTGVVLGTDLSGTHDKWTPQGDIAYRRQTRSEMQKVYVDRDREVAICMTGSFDNAYIDFLSAVLNKDIDIKTAIEKGFLPEMERLHLNRWQGRAPQENSTSSIFMATRFEGKPQLYGCYPLGKIEQTPWSSIGSGSDYARAYIAKQGKLIPRGVDLKEALDLTVKGLDEASQDIYTGGLDIVVVKPEGIFEYGQEIKTAIDSAKKETIAKIKEKLGA